MSTPGSRALALFPRWGYRRSYKSEAYDVLEQTKITATDDAKQFALSFFDNKFASLIPLKILYVLA